MVIDPSDFPAAPMAKLSEMSCCGWSMLPLTENELAADELFSAVWKSCAALPDDPALADATGDAPIPAATTSGMPKRAILRVGVALRFRPCLGILFFPPGPAD